MTPKPCSASTAAGSSVSLNVRVPARFSKASQPSTAPGTVAESMPCSGMRSLKPRAARCSGVAPVGARPLAFNAIELLFLRHPRNHEHIAADAGARRFDHVQDRRARDRGIEGVAARFQNLQAGLRRQGLAGGHDAVARQHFRARLRQPAAGAVAADRREFFDAGSGSPMASAAREQRGARCEQGLRMRETWAGIPHRAAPKFDCTQVLHRSLTATALTTRCAPVIEYLMYSISVELTSVALSPSVARRERRPERTDEIFAEYFSRSAVCFR